MKETKMTEATEYVVFDLEWNRPTTRYRAKNNGVKLKGEIIQIGAIKLNQDLEVVDHFDIFVKPQAYHKMLKEITQITDITNEMLEEGVPFQQAVKLFLDWCGDDYVFCSWSENDIIRLEENMLPRRLSSCHRPSAERAAVSSLVRMYCLRGSRSRQVIFPGSPARAAPHSSQSARVFSLLT